MSDWADHVLGKLNQKRENQRVSDARFVEEQKIKKAHGAPLWRELKNKLRGYTLELKEKSGSDMLVIQSDQPSEMVICNVIDGGRLLHITFEPELGKLSWTCDDQSQNGWEIAITENGGARFQWGMVPTNPDSMARQMLDKALAL